MLKSDAYMIYWIVDFILLLFSALNIHLMIRFFFAGQPYNQLAILEVNRNNKLSSVFYYVRSLAVRHPFPVAATNLEKFYSKLIKDTWVHLLSYPTNKGPWRAY